MITSILLCAEVLRPNPARIYAFDDASTPQFTVSEITEHGLDEISATPIPVNNIQNCEVAVSPSGRFVFLFVQCSVPGQVAFLGTLFVYATESLKEIGHVSVRSSSGSPNWISDSRILFEERGSLPVHEVAFIANDTLVLGNQDTPGHRRVIQTLTTILENLKKIQARPPIGSATYPVFREDQFASRRSKIAVSPSEEQVAFIGTVGDVKSDGASGVYLLDKRTSWSPQLLGLFSNGDNVAFRSGHLIIGFLTDGVLRHFIYALDTGSWTYVGRKLAIDISSGATTNYEPRGVDGSVASRYWRARREKGNLDLSWCNLWR